MKLQIVPPESKERFWMMFKHLVLPFTLLFSLFILIIPLSLLYPPLMHKFGWYILAPLILCFSIIPVYAYIKLRRFYKKIKTDSKLIRKTGFVLIIGGVLSIVCLVLTINPILLFSTNFVLPVLIVGGCLCGIAGIFLARGNVAVVRDVRWNIALFLSGITGYIIALPLLGHILLPFHLIKANLLLQTWWFVSSTVVVLALIVLLFLAYLLMNTRESLDALKRAGFSIRKPWFAYLSGLVVITALLTFQVCLMTGEGAIKAKSAAEEEYGTVYEYHIYEIMIAGDHGNASLIAYNEDEIKTVKVSW